MECYSEQIISIFVDGELAVEDAGRLRDHLATCWRCRQRLDALSAENRVLSESLQELPEEAAVLAKLPHLSPSWAWGDVALVAMVLALGSIMASWMDLLTLPEG